jgi:molybdopterin-guanine dinucleotide biosynthesis protein A
MVKIAEPTSRATVIFVPFRPLLEQSISQTMGKSGSKRKTPSQLNALALQRLNVEICILAGGLSRRMGQDKSRLRLGQTTMLGQIRKTARATGLPVRIIRRDCVPKCGPLGGIYTALKSTKADVVLFLACDMPLVSTELIQFVLRQFDNPGGKTKTVIHNAVFVRSRGAGFPLILRREALEQVEQQIEKGDFSLQSLAKVVKATMLRLTSDWSQQLFNVNTPGEWTTMHTRHFQGGSSREMQAAKTREAKKSLQFDCQCERTAFTSR